MEAQCDKNISDLEVKIFYCSLGKHQSNQLNDFYVFDIMKRNGSTGQ